MTHCERALALFFLPVVIGIAVGLIVSDRVLAALERSQRERREKAVTQVTREAEEAEMRFLIWDTAAQGPVIEWVYDGGASVRSEN